MAFSMQLGQRTMTRNCTPYFKRNISTNSERCVHSFYSVYEVRNIYAEKCYVVIVTQSLLTIFVGE